MKNLLKIIMVFSVPLALILNCANGSEASGNESLKYKITYDANGGTGAPSDVTGLDSGSQVTLSSGTGLSKQGYTFAGWLNEADNRSYSAGATFTLGSADITLKAVWRFSDPDSSILYDNFAYVPGATYTQTDTSNNSFSHTIGSFYMAKYEVTYELWYSIKTWAGSNGFTFQNAGREGKNGTDGAAPTTVGKYRPVTNVSWRDALVWLNAYSEKLGRSPVYKDNAGTILKDSTVGTTIDAAVADWSANGFRLPSEGEWQYAAAYKDGTSFTPHNYSSGANGPTTDSVQTEEVAWIISNSGNYARDVGGKRANQLGIYDMTGNVWEMCWDWYGAYPTNAQTDYRGPASATTSPGYKIFRGSGFYDTAPHNSGVNIGYRLNALTTGNISTDKGLRVAISD